MMLKGMTAQYLLRQTYVVKAGDTILIHAAAGGVGLILCQWAKHLGATVIGTVGSKEKAELAHAHGCDHVILYKEEDFAARVAEITGGKKLPVVYDGIGKATFLKSLDSLRPRGLMVSYGNASGAVEAFNLGLLAQKGLPLRHPPHPLQLHRHPRRAPGLRQRPLRRGEQRCREDRDQPALPPRPGRRRPPRARRPRDDGVDAAGAVREAGEGARSLSRALTHGRIQRRGSFCLYRSPAVPLTPESTTTQAGSFPLPRSARGAPKRNPNKTSRSACHPRPV